MNFIDTRYYSFEDSVPQLPPDILEAARNKARAPLVTSDFTTGKVIIGIAIIVALGGIFLFLAAQNVLPHGVNAISKLEVWGTAAGAVLIESAVVIAIIGVNVLRKMLKSEKEQQRLANSNYQQILKDALEKEEFKREQEYDTLIFDQLEYNELFIRVDGEKSFKVSVKRGDSMDGETFYFNEGESSADISKILQESKLFRNTPIISKEQLDQRIKSKELLANNALDPEAS